MMRFKHHCKLTLRQLTQVYIRNCVSHHYANPPRLMPSDRSIAFKTRENTNTEVDSDRAKCGERPYLTKEKVDQIAENAKIEEEW